MHSGFLLPLDQVLSEWLLLLLPFHVVSLGTKEQELLPGRFAHPTVGRVGPPLSKRKGKRSPAGI